MTGRHHPVDRHEQRTGLLRRRGGECRSYVLRLSYVKKLAFDVQRPRGKLNLLPAQCKGGIPHIVHGCHPEDTRHQLFDQLYSLCLSVVIDRRQSGDVPTWPGKVGGKSTADRIADRRHYDGNGFGCIPRGQGRRCTSRHYEIDVETYELRRQRCEAFGAAVGRSILDEKILSFNVS